MANAATRWRLHREGIRLSIAIVLVACGGGSSPSLETRAARTEATSTPPAVEPTAGAEIVAPPPVTELTGAAAPPPEPTIPADTVDLGSRMAPRALSIPSTPGGRTSRFTFDGFRRGWMARLPHGSQRLLTPIYGDGKVYVGGGFSSHSLFAYDARTGERMWTASAPDGGPSAAILEDGKVLFNTESCTLFAVDARTGRQLWSRWLGDPLMSQPAAANGLVFSGHIIDHQSPGGLTPGVTGFGTGEGRRYAFTALSLANGRPRWTRAISADVMNAPVIEGDGVFFTTMDGVVYHLDQQTGRVRWRRNLRATSAPWLHGETVHVSVRARDAEGRRSERAVVLAKADGETLREHDPVDARFLAARPDGDVHTGWGYEGSRATIVDGRSYQTIGNEVHARDATTGELLWRRRYASEVRDRPASPPAIAGAQLVFGTQDGVLFGLDIDTGMTTWAYDVGEPIAAQPTVAHGWVYASTTRGGVVALEVSDVTFDGWHMWGGNAQHNGRVENTSAPVERDERPSEGALRLGSAPRNGEVAGFPLESTRVSASVSGFVARVAVEQTFRNPYDRPVEAVYLFPLPDDAAVDAMELRAGTRVVRAQILRRQQARERYEDARDRGVLASLLEQERPNLFRQSVANIRPGDAIRVTLHYTQVLPYEEGSYRFVYPMVAGPRYAPGEPSEASAGTQQLVLAPGAERPDRVEVSIDADLGLPVREVSSPTHAIRVDRGGGRGGERRLRVELDGPARPDRDLDVRFQVAGEAPTVGVIASAPTEGERGHFALALHPRLEVAEAEVMPRELVFVVDTSSSMHGRPIELARAAMLRALDGLRPTDTFRVLSFSDTTSALSDEALVASPENVQRARQFVSELRALGATEMQRGLHAALSPPTENGRMRIVLLMTDGYIGNETEIFRAVHDELGQSRVFAFGVGSAVNRYLLTRLAEVGRGDVQVVTLDESPEAAADRFHERIARPFLTDVSIDWGSLAVADAYPRRLPDLYADRPLVVHARYPEGASGDVVIRGRVAGRPFAQTVRVELPASGDARPELASVWARTRIRDLMTAMALRPSDALREEVTQLGLTHHLLTEWTAFLAIDEGYRVDGPAQTVEQPAALPAGVTSPRPSSPRPRVTAARSAASVGAPMVLHAPSMDVGGGGYGAVHAIPAAAQPARPMERMDRGRRSSSSCYDQARRPDGTIDAAALEECLRRQRGGAEKRGPSKREMHGQLAPMAVSATRRAGRRTMGRRRSRLTRAR
jgi:Ca-activated chloride channel family protein